MEKEYTMAEIAELLGMTRQGIDWYVRERGWLERDGRKIGREQKGAYRWVLPQWVVERIREERAGGEEEKKRKQELDERMKRRQKT